MEGLIMTKRKSLGYVYLLKSDTVLSDDFGEYVYYKWGCTRKTPEERCRVINQRNKKYGKFSVIDSFYTKNPFYFERQFLLFSQTIKEFVGVYKKDKDILENIFCEFKQKVIDGKIK